MKTIKMSLISHQGKVVNEWTVPYARRRDALSHALDRSEQEGHAGVLWAQVNNGTIQEFIFDSHDPAAVSAFAGRLSPFLNKDGKLEIDRLLG